jgi:gamma-glutamylcyclotransferase (GGCT)/AIG2-like uncharacterized protein YtfP
MYKVSVYGTLRSGCGNNVLLGGSNFLGTTKTKEMYTLRSLGGCPAVDKSVPTHQVVVEVYEVTPDVLSRLDRLEGYHSPDDHWYNRSMTETVDFGDSFMYHINNTNYPVIDSGDWMNRTATQVWRG